MRIVILSPDFNMCMENLFVYGTLQFQQIVKRLTGKKFETVPAYLPGYKRCRVKGCDYPAAVETPDSEIKGMLLKNVDNRSMRQFTFFEGDEYEKRKVLVSVQHEEINAVTFVWCRDAQLLAAEDWDENHFEKYSLNKYC